MHDDFPQRVFKATERPGVTSFEPRPFWHLNGSARSGSAADPAKVPPDADVVHGMYATRDSFVPFFFPPRHCPRFSIDPAANEAAVPVLVRTLGPLPAHRPRVVVFRAADRGELSKFEFSVYAFDARPFRRLSTGEFFADTAVAPVAETRRRNAISAIEGAGWTVRFVDGIEALRQLRSGLETVDVSRFSCEKM